MILQTDLQQAVAMQCLKSEVVRLREENKRLNQELEQLTDIRSNPLYDDIAMIADSYDIDLSKEDIETVSRAMLKNEWVWEQVNTAIMEEIARHVTK